MPSSPSPDVHASREARGYDEPHLFAVVERLLADAGALTAVGGARRVVLKPNWVHHDNPIGHDLSCLVTHPRVIEAVAEAVARRVAPGARVVIGDAPMQSCDFERLRKVNGLDDVVQRLRRAHPAVDFSVADWRLVRTASRFAWRATERVEAWDPDSHELVDLGTRSFLEPISDRSDRFRVTCYAPSAIQARHHPGVHQYLVARAALEADVLINLPKLKTHIKAGVTGALKNLVGINGHKEFLPHHVTGTPETGGDSHALANPLRDGFERYYDFHFEHLATLPRPLISVLSRALNAADRATARLDASNFGSWPGNDTVWRMTLDLNHLLYAWAPTRPGAIFNLVDALTVGVGDGPLRPRPAALGVLLAGQNPATLDAVGASLLGFDPLALPTVRHALEDERSFFKAPLPGDLKLVGVSALRPVNWERVAGLAGR